MDERLRVDRSMVDACRDHARVVADGVYRLISGKTTVSVERTICRLLGIDGVDERGVPLPNVVSDYLQSESLVGDGAWYTLARIIAATGCTPIDSARRIAAGQLDATGLPHIDAGRARELLDPHLVDGIARIDDARAAREELKAQYPHRSHAQGADIVAVIRTTAQSLLDYVPYGLTTEGFGGTYATQENFRLMREGLDEVGAEVGPLHPLCNYVSGLCMPEIAYMGSIERLDMMLNDSMYGIIFRDINMRAHVRRPVPRGCSTPAPASSSTPARTTT
jgi:beta-lysine 5,6-aminomutase alpha subunit